MEQKESQVKGLLGRVTDRISDCGNEVAKRLEDAMVEKEVARRASVLDSAIQKYEEFSDQLKKMKPDNVSVSDDGVKTATWTIKAHEARERLQEKLNKLESAINSALNKDFKRLEDTLKKLGS